MSEPTKQQMIAEAEAAVRLLRRIYKVYPLVSDDDATTYRGILDREAARVEEQAELGIKAFVNGASIRYELFPRKNVESLIAKRLGPKGESDGR